MLRGANVRYQPYRASRGPVASAPHRGQHLIPRAIHHTHTAFANLRKNSVVTQRLSDHCRGQRAILTRPLLQTGRQ